MRRRFRFVPAGAALLLLAASEAFAVPVLQVGVRDGTGFVPYTTVDSDANTAFTTGSQLVLGGAFGPNVVALGGQYGGGDDYSALGLPTNFNGKGAILMASVAQGSVVGGGLQPGLGLTVSLNGVNYSPFFWAQDLSLWSNNHYPVQSSVSDFLFFDVGNFVNGPNGAPNFASPSDVGSGSVKDAWFSATGLSSVHFDLMAIETTMKVTGPEKKLKTTWDSDLEVNPNSKDVTWTRVPEPGTMLVLGTGLMGLAGVARRRRQ